MRKEKEEKKTLSQLLKQGHQLRPEIRSPEEGSFQAWLILILAWSDPGTSPILTLPSLSSRLCPRAEPLRVARWLPGLQMSNLPDVIETRPSTTSAEKKTQTTAKEISYAEVVSTLFNWDTLTWASYKCIKQK